MVPVTIPNSGNNILADWVEKQTQSNPLRLSSFDSKGCVCLRQNKPIKVNTFFLQSVTREKRPILEKYGWNTTSLLPIARRWKLEHGRSKREGKRHSEFDVEARIPQSGFRILDSPAITFKAGMSCRMRMIHTVDIAPIPDLREVGIKSQKSGVRVSVENREALVGASVT